MLPRASHTVIRLQDRLAGLLGTTVEGRSGLVSAMLERNPNEATSYWLQLVVSAGIATLGLVVGSTAVVIGAMLVAPLMGPIIGLAMGLASGSPFLVLRSAGRIVLSVLVAIGGAATITFLLPFHEINAEIASRTSPTVLDLITAGFCALAGVYASLRPGSETATTAAGTSISISLVPPLCASGYGFGTLNSTIAAGASLLFLTNLVAIVVVGTLTFVASGFNRVDVVTLEKKELEREQNARFSRAVARRLSGLFESRIGPVLRFFMPLVLLAVVYVPLRRALDEVAWEVRVRAAVRGALAQESGRVVQSRVHVERRDVDVAVVIVGDNGDAQDVRKFLSDRIRPVAGDSARIQVLAVPDATAFAGLQSSLSAPGVPPLAVTQAVEPLPARIRTALAEVHEQLATVWPATSAGEVTSVAASVDADGSLRLSLTHLGHPLEAQARESVRRALGAALEREVRLDDVAIPAIELGREQGDIQFVATVSQALATSLSVPQMRVCVARPEVEAGESRAAREPLGNEASMTLTELLLAHPRVDFSAGEDWRVQFVLGACEASEKPVAMPAAAASANAPKP